MQTKPLVLALVGLALASCAAANRPDAALRPGDATPVDDTLAIALGGSGVTRGGAVRVSFIEKLADSRCAIDVVCVWAGDVGARLRVETLEVAGEQPVHTAIEPKTIDVGGYRVTLLNVTPLPGDKTAQPHVATVRVLRPIPPR